MGMGRGNAVGTLSLFFKDFIYLFAERGEGRERNMNQLALACPS